MAELVFYIREALSTQEEKWAVDLTSAVPEVMGRGRRREAGGPGVGIPGWISFPWRND